MGVSQGPWACPAALCTGPAGRAQRERGAAGRRRGGGAIYVGVIASMLTRCTFTDNRAVGGAFPASAGALGLGGRTTRTEHGNDSGKADLGAHDPR